MEGHAKKCVERHCEMVNMRTEQLYKVSAPCLDDHHFKKEELESVGEESEVCSRIVLKCLFLARIDGPDTLWSVNKLARAVTKGQEQVTNVWLVRFRTLNQHSCAAMNNEESAPT